MSEIILNFMLKFLQNREIDSSYKFYCIVCKNMKCKNNPIICSICYNILWCKKCKKHCYEDSYDWICNSKHN